MHMQKNLLPILKNSEINSGQYTFVCGDDGILYLLPRWLELIALTSATNLLNMCLDKTARTGEVLHAAITVQSLTCVCVHTGSALMFGKTAVV